MLPGDFYKMVDDGDELLFFLENIGIIPNYNEENCPKCFGQLKIIKRGGKEKILFYIRCTKCRSEQSLFKNTFFHNDNPNSRSKLSIQCLLKLIYAYFDLKTIRKIKLIAGIKCNKTVIYWTNSVRERISNYLNSREKLGGSGQIVQIDESLIRGKRKYGVGRLLIRDLIDSVPEHNSRRQNFGNRTDGPWVYSMIVKDTRKA